MDIKTTLLYDNKMLLYKSLEHIFEHNLVNPSIKKSNATAYHRCFVTVIDVALITKGHKEQKAATLLFYEIEP